MSGTRSRARRTYRWLRKGAKRASSYGLFARYWVRNRLDRSSALGDAAVTVSLTTYGSRIDTVAYTIESIAVGRARPRRLVLWLDDAERFEHLPASLRRLQKRGLEVALTKNWGPHTKYFPALASTFAEGSALITADDDIFYPASWLHGLLRAAERDPDEVVCYRASVVAVTADAVADYASWPQCKTDEASLIHFATGVSGVYYPPRMVEALLSSGDEFWKLCPSADDLWLHRVALRHSVPIRQVSARGHHFPYVPGSQLQTLVSQNLAGGNDLQIRRLYEERDVAVLRALGAPEA